MDQQATARDEVPLGLESAWPGSDQLAIIFGGPTAVQRLDSSSSPKRDPEVGAALPLRLARGALAALLLAVLPAAAAPYAPQEHDFSELSSAFGTVESVREVPLPAAPSGLADVFEHRLNADSGVELMVRLDDGRLVVVTQDAAQRFQPGDRVRLLDRGRVLRT